MVSFWPWKVRQRSQNTAVQVLTTTQQGDPNSAESFEKQLSALATKIAKATNQNDGLRQRARMLKVGWILWGGISYIIASAVLFLTHGWQNWGVVEIGIVVGGPVILYAVRALLNAWYNYRTTNSQDYLDGLYKERDATIEKLKQATKYNSTQQLLEKYGSAPKKLDAPNTSPKRAPRTSTGRTNLPIPPTANIQRKPPVQVLEGQVHPETGSLALEAEKTSIAHRESATIWSPPASPRTGEEFAPNAFDGPPPQYTSSTQRHVESHWYDRIFDALLGEDETLAKNRLALICKRCRIINGLAPPGIKTPEELGKWRCSGCGAWNGEEFEAARLLREASKTETSALEAAAVETGDGPPNTLRERKGGHKDRNEGDDE